MLFLLLLLLSFILMLIRCRGRQWIVGGLGVEELFDMGRRRGSRDQIPVLHRYLELARVWSRRRLVLDQT